MRTVLSLCNSRSLAAQRSALSAPSLTASSVAAGAARSVAPFPSCVHSQSVSEPDDICLLPVSRKPPKTARIAASVNRRRLARLMLSPSRFSWRYQKNGHTIAD